MQEGARAPSAPLPQLRPCPLLKEKSLHLHMYTTRFPKKNARFSKLKNIPNLLFSDDLKGKNY